jgi:hypothetical protein
MNRLKNIKRSNQKAKSTKQEIKVELKLNRIQQR